MSTATERRSHADIVRERVSGSMENMTLDYDAKEIARSIVPMERKTNGTKKLAERYLKRVSEPCRLMESRKKGSSLMAAAQQVGRLAESHMIQMWDRGEFQINGKDGVAIEEMTEIICHNLTRQNKKGTRLTEAWKAFKSGDGRLQEHAVSGVGQSQYGRYLDTVMRLGTLEMCRSVDVAPILGLVGNIQVDCGQQTLVSDLVPVDIRRELHPMAEGEPTPFFGVGSPVETLLPKRHKIKFAYAINREAQCKGLDQALRDVMVLGAQQIDRYWAPNIIQLLFGMFAAAADNEWAYVLNGQRWRTEYQPPTTAGAVPYENLLYNKEDISRLDDALFVLIEQMFRKMKDFRTGDPITCVQGPLKIIGTGFKQLEDIAAAMGALTVSKATGGSGNTVVEFSQASRGRWDINSMFDSPWIERYLDEFMQVQWPGWTAAERTEAIERSFVAGNPQAAMVMQDEWGPEEFDMPTEWTSFDREVIWGRKFMRKSNLGTIQPQARFVVKGLPDSEDVPAVDSDPIS